MTISIQQLAADQRSLWDEFVYAEDHSTFFHLSGWQQVIEESFGHRCIFLLARENGSAVGCLPLVEVKSRLFGHGLISLPFCVYGGPLAINDAVRDALLEEAVIWQRKLGANYLELRQRDHSIEGWPEKSLYFTFRKTFTEDHDANLASVPRKQRAMIRKGDKNQLIDQLETDTSAFYSCYSESLRNLGTPVLGAKYFQILAKVFPQQVQIMTVRKDQQVAAALLSFIFKDELLPYYGGGRPLARALKAYDFMYWRALVRSVDEGRLIFDFGRSKRDTGSYAFKKHWGFEAQALHYQYHLAPGQDMPDVSPNNRKYEMAINLWRRLPLSISRKLGPPLAKYLG